MSRRPFMLYHWSPAARRQSILRNGLCPCKKSPDGIWRPPYLCFGTTRSMAWCASATHSGKLGSWDLWCCWSDQVGDWVTVNSGREPRVQWWLTEYRTFRRIPKRNLWHVGTRVFRPRNWKKTLAAQTKAAAGQYKKEG